jgi:hypothetical protein
MPAPAPSTGQARTIGGPGRLVPDRGQPAGAPSRVLRKSYTPTVTPLITVASPLTRTRAVLVSPVTM